MEKHLLEIDSSIRKFTLDGQPWGDNVTILNIEITGGKSANVTVTMNTGVKLSGILVQGNVAPLTCSNCGYFLGDIIGPCSVLCPNCQELMVGQIGNCEADQFRDTSQT